MSGLRRSVIVTLFHGGGSKCLCDKCRAMFRLRFGGLAVLCSMLRESGFLGSGSWRHPERGYGMSQLRRQLVAVGHWRKNRSNHGNSRQVMSRSRYDMRLVIKEVNNANNADCHDSGLLAGNQSGARSLRPQQCRAMLQVREQFGGAVMCMMSGQPILPGRDKGEQVKVSCIHTGTRNVGGRV